jgi:hypothetical protein
LALQECILIEIRDKQQERCLNLSAQVVWVEPDPQAVHSVGCELRKELTRKQLALLQQFVRKPAATTGR